MIKITVYFLITVEFRQMAPSGVHSRLAVCIAKWRNKGALRQTL